MFYKNHRIHLFNLGSLSSFINFTRPAFIKETRLPFFYPPYFKKDKSNKFI